jgi:sugar phosphate permease
LNDIPKDTNMKQYAEPHPDLARLPTRRSWQDARGPETVAKATKIRWVILFLIGLMYLLCYMDRSYISVAQPEIAKHFGLNKAGMGLVLASFTLAYAIGQVPAGWFGDRFGPKRVLTALMLLWSASAAMTGAVFGFTSLLSARFLLGLGEAGAFPVATSGMQLWFPRVERGRIQGTVHFLGRFAVALTPFIAAWIMPVFGWRTLFYVFGALGVLWALCFTAFYKDFPEHHNRVNRAELAFIRGVNPNDPVKMPEILEAAPPWKEILLSSNMWFISLGNFCLVFTTSFFFTWYPTYLREHLHMSIRSLGMWGSIPLLAGMAGDVIGGSVSDMIFRITSNAGRARRLVAIPSFLLAGCFIIPAALTSNTVNSILFLAASFFFLECIIGPMWALPMDVGGSFSGTVTGVMSAVGSLGGPLMAVFYGALFNLDQWVAPFVVSACVMLAGALIWALLIDPEEPIPRAL